MSKNALIRGTFILTVATFVSKLLGFIYVVPFISMVTVKGNILFEYAYKPYVIILTVATMGVPLAVSKVVSKYNELGDYRTGQKLFRSGLIFSTLTGFLCFILLFSIAPSIAHFLIDSHDHTGNKINDVIFVIRMVSFALIIVPPMAVARGFFQGYQMMKPTAMSQMIEQLVRVVWILIAVFFVLHYTNKGIPFSVGLATFGAFLGAIFGSINLYYYWRKQKSTLKEYADKSIPVNHVNMNQIYKELISYAVPIAFVSLAIPFFQTIDTFTINRAVMASGANQGNAETVNSIVALIQRVILIPVSLATAFGLTLVPLVTQYYTSKKFDVLHDNLRKTYQVLLYLTFPCVTGLMILGRPAFAVLFGTGHAGLGGSIMIWYAPAALILSFFLASVPILQGIDKHRFAVISLLVGLAFKLISNFWFIKTFGGIGSIITTDIGVAISVALNLYMIRKELNFSLKSLLKDTKQITLLNIVMGLVVFIVAHFLHSYLFVSNTHVYIHYLIELVVGAMFGGFIYLFLSIQTGLTTVVFGSRLDKLNKFKFTKKVKNTSL